MQGGSANGQLTIEDLRAAFADLPTLEFRAFPNAKVSSLRWQCGYTLIDDAGEHFRLCVYAASATELYKRLNQPAA